MGHYWNIPKLITNPDLTGRLKYIMDYHMNYSTTLVRTSMSLDAGTLAVLDSLAKRWSVSKAEVMRRAIRRMQEEVEAEDKRPTPLQALEWLQSGAGLSMAESAEFKKEIAGQRQAKRYWWES